jgi:ABC-type polysaccharide/polyol phosphate transport system ATPase subunit
MATILTENVGLDFPIYGMQRSLRRTLFQSATGGFINKKDLQHRHVSVTALAGVSFQLSDGDRLALVGHNGAGKSSLLKVLAGIYYPTSGQVWVDGKIMSLFELTLGIDSEDTGYETIVTAGMLHGMTQAEIESKIPEIERFSELGEYLSLPVRTYSMGMTTRLGFSLATVFEPEILLLEQGIGAPEGTRQKERDPGSGQPYRRSHSFDLQQGSSHEFRTSRQNRPGRRNPLRISH